MLGRLQLVSGGSLFTVSPFPCASALGFRVYRVWGLGFVGFGVYRV